jgi:hypothetical protein
MHKITIRLHLLLLDDTRPSSREYDTGYLERLDEDG